MRVLITLLITCTLFTEVASAQQSKQTETTTLNNDYEVNLKKYRTNKTIAWSLAGTGIVLLGIGIAQPAPQFYINNDPALGYPKRKGGALRIAGGILSVASIPLFIRASKYKRKASVGLKDESATLFDAAGNNFKYPAVSFTVQL